MEVHSLCCCFGIIFLVPRVVPQTNNMYLEALWDAQMRYILRTVYLLGYGVIPRRNTRKSR